MQLPDGYGYPISKQDTWLMIYMFMNHRSVTDTRVRRVQHDRRHPAGPDAGGALLARRRATAASTRSTTSRAAARRARSTRARWSGPMPKAGRLVAARRPRSRRRPGARAAPAGVPEQRGLHVAADLGRQEPSLLQGQTGAARARSDPHDRVLLGARGPARGGREGGARVALRRQPAAHARDGDHGRVPRARRLSDGTLRPRAERPRRAEEAEGPDQATALHGADRRQARRQGREHRRAAGETRLAGQGRHDRGGRPFFRRPNVSLLAGGTLTWRFDGPTLHNITLANGPRGFSSKNLSRAARFKKKLTVPGTYQLFCGLHPVDMTATIKVKGRKK